MYGESGSALRREMTDLLRLHRVQRRFGAADHVAGQVLLVRQYRENVLAWCGNALQLAIPMSFTNLPPRNPNPFEPCGNRSAARDLARALAHARDSSSVTPAALDQLTSRHENYLVEHWRQVARAAALAEGDLDQMGQIITTSQAAGIVSDVSAITQALVVLDRRYRRVSGWTHLEHGASLGWAALAAALDVNLTVPDHSLDTAGWQPRVRPMRGRVPAGLLGVLQAEHNVLAGLDHFPHALRLRLVVDSQRVLSARLSPLARRTEPAQVQFWDERAGTYEAIQRHLRNIGGISGGGGRAASEAANVVVRLRAIDGSTVIEPRTLAGFRMLAERIDDRIAAVVEEGFERGDFVERVKLPRLDATSGKLVHPVRARYRPVLNADAHPLVQTVRQRLSDRRSVCPSGPDASRVELHAELAHRSSDAGSPSMLQL
ncbi:hypothetical protein ACFQW6_10435 [Nocardioides sp. GCM10028917]|uniref:hypothetical protein n=1 Tax=Nocardioides sp. GCM10028917 TaxID=3273408 RepID=UPI003614E1A8